MLTSGRQVSGSGREKPVYPTPNTSATLSNLVWRMNLSHTQMVMMVMMIVMVIRVIMEQKEEGEVGRGGGIIFLRQSP